MWPALLLSRMWRLPDGLYCPQGNAAATQSFWNNPAISSAINTGSQNVQRNAAATGQLTSGATLKALQDQAQQTASGGWNNYVSALQPYLNFSNASAGGIANVNTGLGSAVNANQNNFGQLGWAYGLAEIDISQWQWSHEDDEWLPKRKLLHFILRARNLPKLADALARAVHYGREQGFIPAWAVEAEVTKESADEQQSTDMQAQTP